MTPVPYPFGIQTYILPAVSICRQKFGWNFTFIFLHCSQQGYFLFQQIMQEWDVCVPIISCHIFVAVLNRRHEPLHNISRSVSHVIGSWWLFSTVNLQVAAVESLCIT